ncbi:hypothetical protein C8Q78DRAFT_990163 [Trametes maxima]|nr:hypothetical protein C8Q78DRAFT_990163 [Trametes maxima]
MDKLAVELLTLIFSYACTDGGQTGCALSLVSRRIRDASRPARFHSVSLTTSPAQVQPFLDCYEKERAHSRDMLPRVRHLCLSLFGQGLDLPSPQACPLASSPAPPPPPKSRAEFLASLQRRTQHWRSAQETLDEQYSRVIPALIRAVAPDVHTIALIQLQWRSASLVRCYFPVLRELTLAGGDPSFLPFAFLPTDRPLYPALRRLHHILAWVNRDVDFTQWAVHAPNVTHLRVSRIDAHPHITAATLDQVLSDAHHDEYFPHLRRAMIEPHPAPPPEARMSTAHLIFRDFLVYVDELAGRARVPVKVLPPFRPPRLAPADRTRRPHQLCVRRVKKEWLERVVDGDGCWQEGMHGEADVPLESAPGPGRQFAVGC